MDILDEGLFDNFEDLAEELSKEFERIKQSAVKMSIDKNKQVLNGEAGARSSGILIKRQVQLDIDKALAKFERSKDLIIDELENQLSHYEIHLSVSDMANINQKISVISKELLGQTNILTSDIEDILLGSLGKGIPESILVAQLASLYPNYSRYAYTIVNTGLQKVYIDSTTAKFAERGYDFYTWAGPNDTLTRDNPCKRFVWKYFLGSELSQLRSIRMRLYNCRHSIAPITAKQAKGMQRGNIDAYSPYVSKKGLKKTKK